ncbi:Uncharacterised protein [Bordetella pertussis]|nr:Uncharacterised protein [Bordetella pertussis]CFP67536.1 Uncharacterised protein [Bordetella pertussis]CFU90709.1 Uncharacterised protein [Bordetella pertussis]CFW00971.1 Uncharacterised protein [Bordetella pertussis]CFW46443.1 Uncharacterised protein [Bordetella pertussis]
MTAQPVTLTRQSSSEMSMACPSPLRLRCSSAPRIAVEA